MRFKVGELAIIAVDAGGNGHEGQMVEIVEVGPMWMMPNDGSLKPLLMDYQVNIEGEHPLNGKWFVWDWELRKIDPPAEPAELTRTEEQEMKA